MKPLAIDLFCGLGGWTEGFLAEGYDVIGFDIERRPYPAQLVLQDVLTLHGSQFKGAVVIVASPPCQAYSYRAMPWKRAKALPPPDNSLFEACFRIAAEAGLPIVVENVKGAQKWVGRAKAHFGSFYLWGDVESIGNAIVRSGRVEFGVPMLRAAGRVQKCNPDGTEHGQGSWFKVADSKNRGSGQKGRTNFHFFEQTGLPSPSFHGAEHEPSVQRAHAIKNNGGSWFNIAHNTESGLGNNPDGRKQEGLAEALAERRKAAGSKVTGDWFGTYADQKAAGTISPGRLHGKNIPKRKQASASIAKIPFELARHIAAVFKP